MAHSKNGNYNFNHLAFCLLSYIKLKAARDHLQGWANNANNGSLPFFAFLASEWHTQTQDDF